MQVLVRFTVVSLMFAGCPLLGQSLRPVKVVGVEYPLVAVLAGVTGTVKVTCVINTAGDVIKADVLEVSGIAARGDMLSNLAKDNALEWRFSASEVSEANRSVILTYAFRIEAVQQLERVKSKFVFEYPNTVTIIGQLRDDPPQLNAKD